MSKTLQLNNQIEFISFLDNISKINASAVLDVHKTKITSLVSSADNTLYVYGECPVTSEFEGTLNVPDCKKLSDVLAAISSNTITFTVAQNNIEYKDSNIKFKYHLFEDGLLTSPNLNIDKINAFKIDHKFLLTSQELKAILKGSKFTSDTNKLYLYTEGGVLKAELTDRAKINTNVLAISLSEVDFELPIIPIKFDNIRLLYENSSDYTFNINNEYGVLIVETCSGDTIFKYIINSLIQ